MIPESPPVDNGLRERVAAALFEVRPGRASPWDEALERTREAFREQADSALDAVPVGWVRVLSGWGMAKAGDE